MDLTTDYLGMTLKNPFVPSSTPLTKSITSARQLEDFGAPALIMHSIFQEEIEQSAQPQPEARTLGRLLRGKQSTVVTTAAADHYLELLRQMKSSLDIPVVASMNGTSVGKWLEFSKHLEMAGADALEINVYYVAADITEPAECVEQRLIDVIKELKVHLTIPLNVKLSPYFSSVGHLIKRLEKEGVQGISLFNRFYQPNIDLETQQISGSLELSMTGDALLAMRWIAILYGRTSLSIAATGGIHFAEDALKAILCGADVTHLGSTLLANGPQHLERIAQSTEKWLEQHNYKSVRELKGVLSQQHADDPAVFERGYYIRLLNSFNAGKTDSSKRNK